MDLEGSERDWTLHGQSNVDFIKEEGMLQRGQPEETWGAHCVELDTKEVSVKTTTQQ